VPIIVEVTADCTLLAGFGACAEKCRIACCVSEFVIAEDIAMVSVGKELKSVREVALKGCDTKPLTWAKGKNEELSP